MKQITNILIEEPKPFINNYKFIKGFEKGRLNLNSQKIGNISRSNLKIKNFKVKEVPVLAKILDTCFFTRNCRSFDGRGNKI